ncbi:MAG: hypothetical protein QOJ64_3089 [Acidobacteriota bacterium]|jgi:hypothetical protein|nr:hypothetical protein [Acidobacteriota bacterium]
MREKREERHHLQHPRIVSIQIRSGIHGATDCQMICRLLTGLPLEKFEVNGVFKPGDIER